MQGDKEFSTEVEILGKLRHPYLVNLVGACREDTQRLAVFDFMPGGSLRDNLDGTHTDCLIGPRPILGWSTRISIALAAARGLAYLHEVSPPPSRCTFFHGVGHGHIGSHFTTATSWQENLVFAT